MAKQPANKIAAQGMIRSYTRVVDGGLKIGFKDLLFADGHREKLDSWIDDKRQVRVTIEAEALLYDDDT